MAKTRPCDCPSPRAAGAHPSSGRRLARPRGKALPPVVGVLVLAGTIFYWHFEDWTIIEALYFSVVALTTVGFGDFTPTSAGTQIFTIIYILTGIGLLVALLTSVAQQFLSQKAERISALRHRREGG